MLNIYNLNGDGKLFYPVKLGSYATMIEADAALREMNKARSFESVITAKEFEDGQPVRPAEIGLAGYGFAWGQG